MMNQFAKLSHKDQTLLIFLALVLVCFGLYRAAWVPLSEANQTLKRQNDSAYAQLLEVRRLASQHNRVKDELADRSSNKKSLSKLIDQVTNHNKLSMERFQQSSNGDIQVRFNDVSFNSLVYWLNELESENSVSIRELSILPGSASGLVKVSVRVYVQ